PLPPRPARSNPEPGSLLLLPLLLQLPAAGSARGRRRKGTP
ncbi:TPA: PEP-CTERM sorting domain-containing protein, partial [Stenotrophomonas maltophilia]